jgi:hypothetical protein
VGYGTEVGGGRGVLVGCGVLVGSGVGVAVDVAVAVGVGVFVGSGWNGVALCVGLVERPNWAMVLVGLALDTNDENP